MKPDKLPTLDPSVRGIFDAIVDAAARVRLERKSEEFRHAEKRRNEAAIALRELRAREAREAERERMMTDRVAYVPVIQPQPLLTLSEKKGALIQGTLSDGGVELGDASAHGA